MLRIPIQLALIAVLAIPANPVLAQDRTSTTSERESPEDFAAAEQRRDAKATAVASELRSTYRTERDRIAPLLLTAGYQPPQVMEALLAEGFSLTEASDDVGRYGDEAPSVGSAIEEYEEMAATLEAGGYSAIEVAEVLVAVYDASASGVAHALDFAGYDVTEIGEALGVALETGLTGAVEGLRGGGFSCTDALIAISDEGNGFPAGLARVRGLFDGGCSFNEVATALRDAWDHEAVAHELATAAQP